MDRMCSKIKTNNLPWDFVERMQILEKENQRLMTAQGQMVQETNRKLEFYLNDIQNLRDENNKLKKQNAELKDLCYFLDDDRQQTKRLCKEWQEFGRYTSSVLKKEIENYHQKVGELECRQEELVKENEELKNICETWNQVALARDSGDGSSDPENGNQQQLVAKNAISNFKRCIDEKNFANGKYNNFGRIRRTCSENLTEVDSNCPSSSSLSHSRPSQCELLDYIKGLEVRVQQLEQDRLSMSTSAPNLTTFHSPPSDRPKRNSMQTSQDTETWLDNMNDEICIYVEEADPGSDDDSDGQLSPIVEENEAENSHHSSLENTLSSYKSSEHLAKKYSNESSVSTLALKCFKIENDKGSADRIVPCARIKAISWKYLEPMNASTASSNEMVGPDEEEAI